MVAMKHKHGACGALLNPSSAEPLVWPSPLKFISELNEEARLLLEQALMDANREREKTILKGTAYSLPSPSFSDTASDDNMSEVPLHTLLFHLRRQLFVCSYLYFSKHLQPILTLYKTCVYR